MSTDTGTDQGWHADDDLLAAYAAGRTRPPVTASVEMHLLHCGTCRAGRATTTSRSRPSCGGASARRRSSAWASP